MISKIFESTKGQAVASTRTICEIHREIFDKLIIYFSDRPGGLKKVIPLLDEAFIVGVKMNKRMVEAKLNHSFELNDRINKDIQRQKRKELVEAINQNEEFLKRYA